MDTYHTDKQRKLRSTCAYVMFSEILTLLGRDFEKQKWITSDNSFIICIYNPPSLIRKASLSICTRAKGLLWIEATTGAWSWLSKWWRCWSVWWRDSSGKELRSMKCSVASCLAAALLMQFLLYVSYRRSTWLPTSRSTWPSSTWRKILIEFHGMSFGGQCAN